MSNIEKSFVASWMEKLKAGWTGKRKEDIFKLFEKTERYYERPFSPATTLEEIKEYWKDIDALEDITFDYNIVAIDGNVACVHWKNKYKYQGKNYHLDGIFSIKFNANNECVELRQWWFMEE